jgi:hypothetical protein
VLHLCSQNGTQKSIVRSWETVLTSSERYGDRAEEQNEDKNMGAATTTSFSIPISAPTIHAARTNAKRRRITPQAGHALESLAHALEFLTDEFMNQEGATSARNEQLEAIQILMALNRQVYFECPEVPTFWERCRTWLHFRSL